MWSVHQPAISRAALRSRSKSGQRPVPDRHRNEERPIGFSMLESCSMPTAFLKESAEKRRTLLNRFRKTGHKPASRIRTLAIHLRAPGKSSSLSRGPSLCLYHGRALKSLNREIGQFFRLCIRRASLKFHSILEDASILESHSASVRKRRTCPTDCSEKSLLRFAKPSRGAHRITPATVRLAQFENPPPECYKSDLRHALNFCCTWQNCRCAGKGFPDVARVSFPFRTRVSGFVLANPDQVLFSGLYLQTLD